MAKIHPSPPAVFLRFFRWFCHPRLVGHIEGDLMEVYIKRVQKKGKRKADIKFIVDVLQLFRPGIIMPMEGYKNLNTYSMYRSYFKIGWRNLVRNKGYSFVNIGGLALGMAVAMLIGLWMQDELTYNSYHSNHDRIAQVRCHEVSNGQIETRQSNPAVMAEEIRKVYGSDFKYVVQSSWNDPHTLTHGDKMFSHPGNYFEPQITDVLNLRMLYGSSGRWRDIKI